MVLAPEDHVAMVLHRRHKDNRPVTLWLALAVFHTPRLCAVSHPRVNSKEVRHLGNGAGDATADKDGCVLGARRGAEACNGGARVGKDGACDLCALAHL